MPKKVYTILAAIVIAVIIILAVVLSTQNQTPPPVKAVTGLVPGDTFTYSIKGYADFNTENASEIGSFKELNQTDFYRVTINSISGSDISFNTTWRFLNGTEANSHGSGNLLKGIDDTQFWAIYPSNLTLNALVRPLGSDGMIVNQTETKNYQAGDRATNIMTYQTQFLDANDPSLSRAVDDYIYVYFDKASGMLVELKDLQIYSDQVFLTAEWQLVQTNLWEV
jgi:hypothetical protein